MPFRYRDPPCCPIQSADSHVWAQWYGPRDPRVASRVLETSSAIEDVLVVAVISSLRRRGNVRAPFSSREGIA